MLPHATKAARESPESLRESSGTGVSVDTTSSSSVLAMSMDLRRRRRFELSRRVNEDGSAGATPTRPKPRRPSPDTPHVCNMLRVGEPPRLFRSVRGSHYASRRAGALHFTQHGRLLPSSSLSGQHGIFLMATKIQSHWLLWHCQRIITKSAANSQNFVMMLD